MTTSPHSPLGIPDLKQVKREELVKETTKKANDSDSDGYTAVNDPCTPPASFSLHGC